MWWVQCGATEKKSHPRTEKGVFTKYLSPFLCSNWSCCCNEPFQATPSASLFLFSPGSHFPLLSVYFPHSAYELSGYNETFRDTLRVTGHDANSGFAACVPLGMGARLARKDAASAAHTFFISYLIRRRFKKGIKKSHFLWNKVRLLKFCYFASKIFWNRYQNPKTICKFR